jgi:glycosyltransferase involved in cell wall biosynthesis
MSKPKTEVLFCTDGVFPHAVGGMQRHSRLLAEAPAEIHSVSVTVLHPHQGVKVFNHASIKEIVVPHEPKSKTYLVDCYHYSQKVFEIINKFPNAVIYSQGLSVWNNVSKVSNRIIINPHGLESYQTISLKDYLIGVPFRAIFNHLFRNSLKVVSLGGRLTKILKRVAGEKKVVVLSNAVNIPAPVARQFDHSGPLKFLFVGRFALNKGINILAEAVKERNAEGYENKFTFDLVGKGPLYETYKNRYNFKNLNFIGFADDDKLNNLYSTDDVFVLPTLFEGMPTVVLEAMAHGMPVIVTDVGATLEMVDESNGYIIEKNNVASLKNAILAYSKLTALEKQLKSEKSFKKVKETFSWKIVAEKHAHLFNEIASHK